MCVSSVCLCQQTDTLYAPSPPPPQELLQRCNAISIVTSERQQLLFSRPREPARQENINLGQPAVLVLSADVVRPMLPVQAEHLNDPGAQWTTTKRTTGGGP